MKTAANDLAIGRMEDDQNAVALLTIERLHEEFKGSRPGPCCHRRRQALAMV
jgi:hypothetical protein